MNLAQALLYIIKILVSAFGGYYIAEKIFNKIGKDTLSKIPQWLQYTLAFVLWAGLGLTIERIMTWLGF